MMVPLKQKFCQNLLEPIDVRGCLLIELQCLSSLMLPPPLAQIATLEIAQSLKALTGHILQRFKGTAVHILKLMGEGGSRP